MALDNRWAPYRHRPSCFFQWVNIIFSANLKIFVLFTWDFTAHYSNEMPRDQKKLVILSVYSTVNMCSFMFICDTMVNWFAYVTYDNWFKIIFMLVKRKIKRPASLWSAFISILQLTIYFLTNGINSLGFYKCLYLKYPVVVFY